VGLASLAGYLLQDGHEVQIIDCNNQGLSIEDVVAELRKYPPDLVGLYTISYNFPVVQMLVAAIKEANKSQKIVAGGPHATFMAKETLRDTPIDYCVLGEGEETLLELVQHLGDNSSELSKIQGLAYKTSEGEIIVTSERVRVKDLDELPFPAIHLLPPLNTYQLYLLHHKRLPYMTVASSRGCPYKCVFCETPSGKIVRAHSPEYVVEYLDFLSKKHGVKEIMFVDDTFTLNEKRIFKLCDLMQKKKLDMTWYSNAHANVRNNDVFKAMRAAGCWIVAVGAESGNQAVIDLMDKGTTLANITATCKGVLDAGLKLKTFFVLGNPGDTPETVEQTIRFAQSLKPHFPVFSLMTPFPGAPLWETAEKYGTFDRSGFDKLTLASDNPVFVPYGLTQELLLQKQKEAFRRLYFSPGMVFRHLAAIESFRDVKVLATAAAAYVNIQFSRLAPHMHTHETIER
jgi:radical SAM superfamily enzyme YgiQ (UPF0313 family)